jgi:hypothetical protein
VKDFLLRKNTKTRILEKTNQINKPIPPSSPVRAQENALEKPHSFTLASRDTFPCIFERSIAD